MSRVQIITSRDKEKETLRDILAKELRNPAPGTSEPLVAIEPLDEKNSRVIVIWDAWHNLPRQERTDVIIDAYEAAFGTDAALNVSLATGLTPTEADRMGFRFEPETQPVLVAA